MNRCSYFNVIKLIDIGFYGELPVFVYLLEVMVLGREGTFRRCLKNQLWRLPWRPGPPASSAFPGRPPLLG